MNISDQIIVTLNEMSKRASEIKEKIQNGDFVYRTKYAMLSNRGDGFKLFVAEGSHAEATRLIHTKYAELLGIDVNTVPALNRANVKELDTMDFSHIGDAKQEVILCN